LVIEHNARACPSQAKSGGAFFARAEDIESMIRQAIIAEIDEKAVEEKEALYHEYIRKPDQRSGDAR
jgi:hypothetical protein